MADTQDEPIDFAMLDIRGVQLGTPEHAEMMRRRADQRHRENGERAESFIRRRAASK